LAAAHERHGHLLGVIGGVEQTAVEADGPMRTFVGIGSRSLDLYLPR
jgi:hypothetical protein